VQSYAVNYFGRSQGISLYQRCNSRYLLSVAFLNYHDGADEFRIEIVGNFVGACVHEVDCRWRLALSKSSPRTLTVDISRLIGYENAGRKLLRRMYGHGTKIAAANPNSLIFLGEITAVPNPGPAPTLLPESVMTSYRANRLEPMRKAAAGRR
jgi:hypothetical protein